MLFFLFYPLVWMPKFRSIILLVITTIALTACSSYSDIIQLPFDAGDGTINSSGADMEPQMSGRYIVFSSDRRGRQDIYLYDVVEKQLLDLPGLNGFDSISSHPSISKDGRYIVFATIRQGRSAIALYDVQTRQVRNLTTNLRADVRNPTISADGSIIAFEATVNGQWDILVYDRNGQPLNVPTDPR